MEVLPSSRTGETHGVQAHPWSAGLRSVPANLERFRESELIHCRWAMAGAAGVIAVELLGQGNWFDAPLWVRLELEKGTKTDRSKASVRVQSLHGVLFSHACRGGERRESA